MPTRSRRAAAAVAANHQDIFHLPEATKATEEEQMLSRLEAYRGDLAGQFQEHCHRLWRRIKMDHESSTALRLALSRLSTSKRRMPFLDYLAQEFDVGEGGGAATESEVDENDPISERLKRSVKRKKSTGCGAKRSRTKAAMGSALDTVAEHESTAMTVPAKSVASKMRQTRSRAAMATPLSAMRGPGSANRAPATRTRGRVAALATASEPQNTRGLGRPLKEGETAFSSVGSPLINPFLLRPQDMRYLKRGDVSQLKKMMARLEDLLHRA